MEYATYEMLELSIGSYFAGRCWGRFDFETGLVETMKSPENIPHVEGESITITQPFDPKELQELIECYYPERWLPEYVNPGVLDGSQWELIVRYDGGKTSRSYGSNAWPKQDGSVGKEPGALFNFVLISLNKILNRWHFDF